MAPLPESISLISRIRPASELLSTSACVQGRVTLRMQQCQRPTRDVGAGLDYKWGQLLLNRTS